jgi:hypothetical protein
MDEDVMKKIKVKPPKPTTSAKKSSSKTSKSKSQKSLVGENASSTLQSKRAANRSQQSETEVVGVFASAGNITSRKRMEMALQESEEAFRTLAETVPQIVWATRADGWNVFFNKRWVKYTGLTLEESYGHGWNIPFHPDDKKRAWDAWQKATKHGATYSLEVRLRRADGVYRWWLVRGVPSLNAAGKIIKWFGTCTDIDDLKQAERRQTLSTEILGILNNPPSMDKAISKIITTLKRETGFDAIGVRLQRGDDFPYIAQDGFSKEFILAENSLAVRTQNGGVCVDKDGNVCLECTCGMVISGKTNPTNPIFTPKGSCCTNESCARPDRPIEDTRLHPRDRCVHEGYHSVALIPLHAGKRIIGILQLNDHRPNQFTLEMISFLEDIGALIGIAVARKRAEDEMKKAKELADALNLQLKAANEDLEERVAARTADLSRTNKQLTQEIGERKRAEEQLTHALKEAKQRAGETEAVLTAINDAVLVYDSDMNVVHTNPGFLPVYGFDPVGMNVRNIIEQSQCRYLDDSPFLFEDQPTPRALRGEKVLNLQFRITRLDGQERILETSSAPLLIGDRLVGTVTVWHDITERKKAEEALRANDEQFRALADSIPNLAWWANGDGYITWYNRRWYEYTGTAPEQMAGWGWQRVHDPEVLPTVMERWKESIATGEPFDMEFPLLGADGLFRPFLTRVLPLKNSAGQVLRWFGTNTDIYELKKAEEALRRSEERLKLALDAAELATWDWHVPSGEVIWNELHYRMLGYQPGEVRPSYQAWSSRVYHEDLAATEKEIRRCMDEGCDYMSEFRVQAPNGTVRWIEARGRFEQDSSGRAVRSYGAMMDITERKLIQEQIKRLNDDLLARNEQLEFANKELESFVYSIAHDLRGPLRHISGFADILMKNIAEKLDEKDKRYFFKICNGTEKMSRLIEDLLNLSRISRQELQRTEVNVSEIAASVVAELREAHPDRSVEVAIKGGLNAFADGGLIEVVLANLLGNAWKFTMMAAHARIELGTIERDDKIVYYVKDNGAGFNQKYAGKMFWPFHQLHSEEAFLGTGIGLAIVERIIRSHRGKVWAEGAEGKGATIYFSLA